MVENGELWVVTIGPRIWSLCGGESRLEEEKLRALERVYGVMCVEKRFGRAVCGEWGWKIKRRER